MGEVAVRCAVEYSELYAESLKEFGQDNTTNAVDSVNTYLELSVLDSLYVSQLEVEYALDVLS